MFIVHLLHTPYQERTSILKYILKQEHHKMSKRSGPSSYDTVQVAPGNSGEAHYKKTIARIAQIQSQFSEAPRGTRLKDKVAVVTGVGSLKGIG